MIARAHAVAPEARRGPDGGLVLDVGGVGLDLAHHANAERAAQGRRGMLADRRDVHPVREDVLQLSASRTRTSATLFRDAHGRAGIGPKVALAIVSGYGARPHLHRAIAGSRTSRAARRSRGIGRKTAQRIVLELKEKLGSVVGVPESSGAGSPHLVARDALVELGYSLLDAERALAQVDPELAPEERVRLALRSAA